MAADDPDNPFGGSSDDVFKVKPGAQGVRSFRVRNLDTGETFHVSKTDQFLSDAKVTLFPEGPPADAAARAREARDACVPLARREGECISLWARRGGGGGGGAGTQSRRERVPATRLALGGALMRWGARVSAQAWVRG